MAQILIVRTASPRTVGQSEQTASATEPSPVPRRCQSMTDAGVTHAEQLYRAGLSLTACARLTGFPASSINRALNKQLTAMRSAGRPRAST